MLQQIINRLKNEILSREESIALEQAHKEWYSKKNPNEYGGPYHDVEQGKEFINKSIKMCDDKIKLIELDKSHLKEEIEYLESLKPY